MKLEDELCALPGVGAVTGLLSLPISKVYQNAAMSVMYYRKILERPLIHIFKN